MEYGCNRVQFKEMLKCKQRHHNRTWSISLQRKYFTGICQEKLSYHYHKICLHFSNALVWSHKRAALLLSALSFMALASEKSSFNVIIQTMMLTISWSLLSSLLPSSYFLLTVCSSSWMCFHNKSERLMFLKCTIQHLWKNPLKPTGTRRGGLLLACNAEHCQGEFQLCPAVFSQFSPHWQTPKVGWAELMRLYLPVAGSSDLRVCGFFLHSSVLN